MASLTQLGELLEHAREGLAMSKREAARRAGISEGRWRQMVSGEQKVSGGTVPVNPRASTVVAAAEAVGVDRREALKAAGFPANWGAGMGSLIPTATPLRDPVEALIAEIYADERIPEDRKHDMVRRMRQAEAERQAVRDEINSYRRAG